VAIQNANKEYNTFVKGIITEANALTFPENASIDEANFVLNRDGSRQIRFGMDFENDFTSTAVPSMTSAAIGVSCHEWINAGNTISNQFAVVQVGDKLLVYNASASAISSSLVATIDASSVIVDETAEIQSACGMGFFFFTSGSGSPAVLEYVGTTVSLRTIDIKIRDYFGVYDGLAVNTKPSTLSDTHKYNLFNQGWDATKNTAVYSNRTSYPSNSEIWYVAKDSNDDFAAGKLNKIDFGSSAAPRGRYIINAFARSADRISQSGISGLPADTELSRPECVGFFQQRIWYSGLDGKQVSTTDTAPSMQGFVFYSRIIRTPQDFGQCHSDADITSEIDNELAGSDGGYLNIPDSGKIYKLLPLNDMMYIFAQNGVWAIRGGDMGFTATEQQVEKISDFGVVSGNSVVKTEEAAFYWSKAGIYLLSSAAEGPTTQNITETTIQSLFTGLPKACKQFATGSYDAVNRRVSWLYNDDITFDGNNYKYNFNTELVLDLVLNAFSKNTISSIDNTNLYVAGYLTTPDLISAAELGGSITKYLALYYESGSSIPNISFAHYKDKDFIDWKSFNGVGKYYEAFLVTGYELLGTSLMQKQAPYIVTYFKRTENIVESVGGSGGVEYDDPSSCILQSRWDFSDSATSGKWGPATEVYRLNRALILPVAGESLDYGHSVVSTKNRLTGRGKALSLKFNSSVGKNIHLLGWSIRYSANTVI
jgi:hypothetical protein